MAARESGQLVWKKASPCDSGSCIEVAESDDEVRVRDSKNPEGPVLTFKPAAWKAFIAGVAAGEFDRR